ncbi:UspA14 [Desulfamplus magnetovallimortis]|uniref:UspA14 n=1 Tax=Desulfamplus magnetovallimortis TaxID=1246637 RepID=A0A1W1HDA3_9BACT|nr:universal stress protein [Desulfamplus magnetovallimortis]SLM30474.1 UspA14 [Desulfamplus magnetovallimortis]
MILPEVNVKNILYPTDLSDNARYAFAYAVSLANLYGAKITILHVMPEDQSIFESHVAGYIKSEKWEEIKAAHYNQARESLIGKQRDHVMIREVLDQFSEESKGQMGRTIGVPADEILIERGNPVEQILKQCREKACDMIVMGSRGHSTLADVVMGTITKRVLRRSEKPVLVVRLPDED